MSRVVLPNKSMFVCDHQDCEAVLGTRVYYDGSANSRLLQIMEATGQGWLVSIGAIEVCSCPDHKANHDALAQAASNGLEASHG